MCLINTHYSNLGNDDKSESDSFVNKWKKCRKIALFMNI